MVILTDAPSTFSRLFSMSCDFYNIFTSCCLIRLTTRRTPRPGTVKSTRSPRS